MKLMVGRKFLLVFLIVCVSACSSFVGSRISNADKIAEVAGFTKKQIKTKNFILTTYFRMSDNSKPVNIYIEGDGFAFARVNRLSVNPTPINPVALKLAAQDPAENIVYIARPCQYTSFSVDTVCEKKYWAGSRYSQQVVDSVNEVVAFFADGRKVNLIGYSGGGTIAVLIASLRKNIISLRTVAGNLDHVALNNYHKVTQLDNSLNAIDVAASLRGLPQRHFLGDRDSVVPLFVITKFMYAVGLDEGCVYLSKIKNVAHHNGWEEKWRNLLLEPLGCRQLAKIQEISYPELTLKEK